MSLHVTLRARTFHFHWCNKSETDYVCLVCGTIAVEGICSHCAGVKARKEASLRKFLADRATERGI